MSVMSGERREERASQAIADFKTVVDGWQDRVGTITALQDKMREFFQKYLDPEGERIILDIILCTPSACPRAIKKSKYYPYLYVCIDLVFIYREGRDCLDITDDDRKAAINNIVIYYSKVFTHLMSDQVASQEDKNDMFDNMARSVAGETQKLYKKTFKDIVRRMISHDEKQAAGAEENEKQGDEEPESEPAEAY
jgi:hypothetical protein